MLFFDLGVFHKRDRTITLKESIVWSVLWIIVALIFNSGVYIWAGPSKGAEFLTCYIIERSLSFDNIFVFILIFSYFKVEDQYKYKILFWGILGALVSRAVCIFSGVALVNKFHWMTYVFGAFLVFMGVKLVFEDGKKIKPEDNPVIKIFKRIFPVSDSSEGGKFFLFKAGRLMATPILLVLVVIDTFDIIFAADSIPAALAITSDSFTIYSANILAILGLRAMYFAVEAFVKMFRYFNYGISVVLVFIGIKMLITDHYKISTGASLAAIVIVLGIAVLLSVIVKDNKNTADPVRNGC
jgi:tellurite resistance protein TerC